jgi:hypothetical protein
VEPANSCFVSYRRVDEDADAFVRAFVKQLRKQVKLYLPNNPLFFDEQGLKPGDLLQKLGPEICRSASMVIFFLPLHFDIHHPWCALEYHAMLGLEQERLRRLGMGLQNDGLIFPVILRGEDALPEELRGRIYANFNHIVSENDFDVPEAQAVIRKLADSIFQRFKALSNAGILDCSDCDTYVLPEFERIRPWLETVYALRAYPTPGH